MRPLLIGYVHALSSRAGARPSPQIHAPLRRFAKQEGYALADVFTEPEYGSRPALAALIEVLRRGEVEDVAVPSMAHFAPFPRLQQATKEWIERETGASVLVLPTAQCCRGKAEPR